VEYIQYSCKVQLFRLKIHAEPVEQATVLLSASVGFLAIPNIDPYSRLIMLISLVFTLGSIMVGVYLLWKHQFGLFRPESIVKELGVEDVILATEMDDGAIFPDIRSLSIVLSIPSVFLAWGVVFFLAAVVLYSVFAVGTESLDQGPRSLVTTILVSTCALVILAVMFRVHVTISYHRHGHRFRRYTRSKEMHDIVGEDLEVDLAEVHAENTMHYAQELEAEIAAEMNKLASG